MKLVSPVILAGSVLLTAGLASLFAGDLNPPAGPIQASFKTLTDVEPRILINAVNTPGDADSVFRITQPGSYYLGANVVGQAGKSGIEIAADGVTIDLNGFDLVGAPGSLDGVRVSVIGVDNLSIRNGGVRLWGENGINTAFPGSAVGARISDIRAYKNGGRGFRVASHTIITGCTAVANHDHGFSTTQNATISNCTAGENAGDGFLIAEGSTIVNCNAYDNDRGIRAVLDCTIIGCTTNLNSNGIAASSSTITGCTAMRNSINGILAGNGSTVSGCTLRSNGANGILAGEGCFITGCTAVSNNVDGIRAASDCRIAGNTCIDNAQAGVHVTGSDNRIEDNQCTDGIRGIHVEAAGNFIARNTASGNTPNYVISGEQTMGPIINSAGPITDPNPWANFAY